jgi:hypothetical protein
MERVGALINKLKEQYDQNVDKNSLLVTLQLLQAELQGQAETANSEKVSVILPKVHRITQDVFSVEPEAVENIPVPAEPETQKEKPAALKPPSRESVYNSLHPKQEPKPVEKKKEESPLFGMFDPVQDVPTLTHQKDVYELNDVHIDGGSLNDKLKEEKRELGSKLKNSPVQDLRKAIGINDRFRFINELFRGDEPMYERSIKTINSLNNLSEAEYWIQRELKVKNGWSDENETVQLFDEVVKRRFS